MRTPSARPRLTLGLALLTVLGACSAPRPAPRALSGETALPAPPEAAQRPHRVEAPAGARDDAYYWLRDDTRSAPDVLAHLRAENAYTDAALAPLSALRGALAAELKRRIAPADLSAPVTKRGYRYATRFVAGGEYPLYVRFRDRAGAAEEVLLDGNALAEGHGYFRVAAHELSASGRMLAWAEDRVGRGQHVIRFKDLTSGALLRDTLENAEEHLAWLNDDQTLLYIEKDPETLLGTRVKTHRLGADPARDPVVYEEKDRAFYLALWKSRSERYLHIYAQATDSSEQWVASADDPALRFAPLLPREAKHEYLAEDAGERWIMRTNFRAPNFRIVAAPLGELAERARWRELVPEPRAGLVQEFAVFRGFFAYEARSEGSLRVYTQRFDAAQAEPVALPGAAYTARLGENPEPDSQTIRLEYSSLTTPDSVYAYHVPSGALSLLKQKPVLGGFSSDEYVSASARATARDGYPIPVSLAHRKGLARDGRAALYLMGYGAYGVSEDPEFDSARVSLLDRGVVLAIAHVRGGQELGRAHYEHGRLREKENSFRDFIDATDFLVRSGYAAPERVAARGASAGGLLMGAVANMAPEKYRVIVAHVPFVDVVTTMLDDSIPLTSNEYDEWGDPRRGADYAWMLAYSPYDNVKRQAYPALFVTTSLWDSQVQYYEPVKWVARLRANKRDDRPLLLRVNMQASHGGRSGRYARLEQIADEYAFVLEQLHAR